MIDVVALAVIAVAAGLGLLQGLTLILVRAAVMWVGLFALRWGQAPLAGLLEPLAGDAADLAAMVLAVILLIVLQQVIAWSYKKVRDALMLGIPDRLMGFAAGALVAFSVVAVVSILGARASDGFARNLAASRVGPWIARCEKIVDRVVTPERLESGRKKLVEWVEAAE